MENAGCRVHTPRRRPLAPLWLSPSGLNASSQTGPAASAGKAAMHTKMDPVACRPVPLDSLPRDYSSPDDLELSASPGVCWSPLLERSVCGTERSAAVCARMPSTTPLPPLREDPSLLAPVVPPVPCTASDGADQGHEESQICQRLASSAGLSATHDPRDKEHNCGAQSSPSSQRLQVSLSPGHLRMALRVLQRGWRDDSCLSAASAGLLNEREEPRRLVSLVAAVAAAVKPAAATVAVPCPAPTTPPLPMAALVACAAEEPKPSPPIGDYQCVSAPAFAARRLQPDPATSSNCAALVSATVAAEEEALCCAIRTLNSRGVALAAPFEASASRVPFQPGVDRAEGLSSGSDSECVLGGVDGNAEDDAEALDEVACLIDALGGSGGGRRREGSGISGASCGWLAAAGAQPPPRADERPLRWRLSLPASCTARASLSSPPPLWLPTEAEAAAYCSVAEAALRVERGGPPQQLHWQSKQGDRGRVDEPAGRISGVALMGLDGEALMGGRLPPAAALRSLHRPGRAVLPVTPPRAAPQRRKRQAAVWRP